MAFTPGDPSEQSAADAAQSRAMNEATGSIGGGSGSDSPAGVVGAGLTLGQFSRLPSEEQSKITGVNIGKNFFGGTNYANQAKAVNEFINRYTKTQGPVNEIEFNEAQNITSKNPFGNLGIGTSILGINPDLLDYTDLYKDLAPQGTMFTTKNVFGETVIKSGGNMLGISAADYVKMPGYKSIPEQIAANQYSKYINPENLPGTLTNPMPGFNPAFTAGIAGAGKLRPGVQYADYVTQFGPVMEQYRQLTPLELGARTVMGLMPGGLLASQIDLKEYGLPGQPGYSGFNPEKPRGPQSMLGNAFKAFKGQLSQGIGSTKQALGDLFAPSAPANIPAEVQRYGPLNENMYGTGDLNLGETLNSGTNSLQDFISGKAKAKEKAMQDAVSSVMSQAQSSPSIANMSLEDKKASISALADENYQRYLDTMPDMPMNENMNGIGIDLSSGLNSGIGSFDVAADVTGMQDVGGGMYRRSYGSSGLDKFMDSLGFGSKKGPSGQIYAPDSKKPNMFKDIVSYFS